jgi:hypothetical protein
MLKIDGVIYDNYTTLERNGLINPDTGLTIFNSDIGRLEMNLGTPGVPNWQPVVPASVDTNTWDVPGAAFVDQTNGNNGTAVVGDGNKPYSTVTAALGASDFVIMKPGDYTQTVFFTGVYNNKHVHAMDGVNFTNGGVYVGGTGVTKAKFTGRATFTGFNCRMVQFSNTNAELFFECAYGDNVSVIAWTTGNTYSPKLKFSADYVRCHAFNGGAYATRMNGTGIDFEFNIKYYAESQHALYHTRNNASGRIIINCPESRCIPNYTSSYGNSAKNVFWMDATRDMEVVHNGDIVHTHNVELLAGALNMANCTNSLLFPDITVNGDIITENTQAVYFWYRAAYGKFVHNGDIINNNAGVGTAGVPIWTQLTGWGSAASQELIFKGSIQGPNRIVVGTGKKMYFYSPFIYNSDLSGTTSHFFKTNTGGNQQSEIYIYNTKLERGNAPGTGEVILGDASLATDIVGSVDVKGTEPTFCSAVADIWAGYTQLAGLIVPKL